MYILIVMTFFRARASIVPEAIQWNKLRPMCILLVTVIFFSNRVINIWNALPDSIVKSTSVNSFKSKINSLYFCDFCADCAVWLYYLI